MKGKKFFIAVMLMVVMAVNTNLILMAEIDYRFTFYPIGESGEELNLEVEDHRVVKIDQNTAYAPLDIDIVEIRSSNEDVITIGDIETHTPEGIELEMVHTVGVIYIDLRLVSAGSSTVTADLLVNGEEVSLSQEFTVHDGTSPRVAIYPFEAFAGKSPRANDDPYNIIFEPLDIVVSNTANNMISDGNSFHAYYTMPWLKVHEDGWNKRFMIETEVSSTNESVVYFFKYKDAQGNPTDKLIGLIRGNGECDIIYKFELDGENYTATQKVRVTNYVDQIPVIKDGLALLQPTPTLIKNGRVMMPARLAENFSYRVSWDDKLKQATLKINDRIINIVINSENMTVDNETVPLDAPAEIIDGRTMVPLRALAEIIGYEVKWDEAARIVFIYSE